MCMRLIGTHGNRVRITGPEILDRKHIPPPLLACSRVLYLAYMHVKTREWVIVLPSWQWSSHVEIDGRGAWILMSAVGATLSYQRGGLESEGELRVGASDGN